ncbi:MAG: T9SS type A sorting domain-containing protein [Prevotellaceae bacterium]|jgi:hypothetical protein|nr:T9SS type A sorting domain-containing protein [Prevotellaceae bacterium]
MKQIIYFIVLLAGGSLCGSPAQAQDGGAPGTSGDPLQTSQEPLIVRDFKINDGSDRTSNRTITLNHTVENGVPTFYSVAEDSTQVGKEWRPYTAQPVFQLSETMGLKDVYFRVANPSGMSNIVSAGIYLDAAVTVESRGLTAQVCPNPVEASATVTVEGDVGQVQVTVYSFSGGVCLTQVFKSSSFEVDLSRCPSGTLLIRLSSGPYYTVKRVIKL